jgi:hypothetical protein
VARRFDLFCDRKRGKTSRFPLTPSKAKKREK